MIGADLRGALRSLRRSPGFALVATLSLALGLGVTTTAFCLLDAIRNPAAGFANARQVYRIQWHFDRRYADMTELWLQQRVLEAVSDIEALTFLSTQVTVVEDRRREALETVVRVEPAFFRMLGVTMALGRAFGEREADVAVISHRLWRRGSRDRGLDGATITVDGRVYRIVGVMPPGSLYPAGASVWLPQETGFRGNRRALLAAGKLILVRSGTDRGALEAQLARLASQLDAQYGMQEAPFAFRLSGIRDAMTRSSPIQTAMLYAAVAVLLIACVNLANLVLARGMARRAELAIRLAIGAKPAAVVRLLLGESVLLAAAGVSLGAVLGIWGARIVGAMLPADIEWLGVIMPRVSWRVFAGAVAAAVGSAAVFGLLPAIKVVRQVELQEVLKSEASSHTGRRRRYSVLVTAQAALSLVLLMATIVLLREGFALARLEFNFAARALDRAIITVPRSAQADPQQLAARAGHLRSTLMRQPGIRDVTMQSFVGLERQVVFADRSGDSVRTITIPGYRRVLPNYLATMGRRLVAGRDFQPSDSGVVILNELAARHLYPGVSAIGHMVRLGGDRGPLAEVVGVVENLAPRYRRAQGETTAEVLVASPSLGARSIEVLMNVDRGSGERRVSIAGLIRDAGWQPRNGVTSYLEVEDLAAGFYRFLTRVFGTMALLALGLSAVGIYGVFSCLVTDREREFAIRIGLGARGVDVGRIVGRELAVSVLAGTAVGGTAALVAVFMFDDLLLNTSPTDVGSLLAAELIVALVAVAAAAGPVLRAVSVNPMRMLRST